MVSLLSHVLHRHQVSTVPLPVQGREHFGRFLSVLRLDVDATLRTLRIYGNVQNLSAVAVAVAR